PGGFTLSSAKSFLSSRFGLGEGRIEGVLLHALSKEPESRLSSEEEAKSYLTSVATEYATVKGITLSSPSAASASSSMMMGGAVSSAALEAYEKKAAHLFRKHLEAYYEYLEQ